MRTARHPAVAALMLLALALQIALPPYAAASDTPPPPVAAPADSAAIAAPAPPRGAPTPAEIATLRSRVGGGVARVRVGADLYDVQSPGFGAAGVAFGAGDLRGVPAWDNGGLNGDDRRPAPLASPISWDRVDRITVRKSSGLRGALVGCVVGTAICGVTLGVAVNNGDEMGLGALALLALPPMGALLGGAIGMFSWRSDPCWQRTVAPGAAAPDGASLQAPVAEAQVAASLQPGVLRDEIGRSAVRVGVGRDRYELRQARVEPAGIAFEPGDLKRHIAVGPDGTYFYGSGDARPSSPIAWDRIDRIETWRRSAHEGAKWGRILLPAALVTHAAANGEDGGEVLMDAVGGVVVGSLLGAGIGACLGHWKLEWKRPSSTPRASR